MTGQSLVLQTGRQEGLQVGETLALQKLLTKRFGVIPAMPGATPQLKTTVDSSLLHDGVSRVA